MTRLLVLSLLPSSCTRVLGGPAVILAMSMLPVLVTPTRAFAQGSNSDVAGEQDRRTRAWIERADAARARGEAASARRRYRQVLRRNPGHAAALIGFAETTVDPWWERPAPREPTQAMRELAQRIEAFRAATAEDAMRTSAHAEGLLLAAQGFHAAAIRTVATPDLRHDPTAARVLDRIALVAARRGDLGAADDAVERARQLSPSTDRDVALADVRMARGRATEAVAILRHASQISRNDPVIARRLGEALMAAGRPSEAALVFEAIVSECGLDCRALISRAFLQAGQHDEAGEAAAQLTALSAGDDPRGPLLEALAAAASGQRSVAMERIREARRRAPRDPSVRQAASAILR